MDQSNPSGIHGPPAQQVKSETYKNPATPDLDTAPQTNFSPPPDQLTTLPRKRYARGSPRGLPRGEPVNPIHGPPSHSPPFFWPDSTNLPEKALPPGPPPRQESKLRPPSAYLYCPFPAPPFTKTQNTSFTSQAGNRPVPPMPKAPEEEINELTRYRYRRRLSSAAAHLKRERIKARDFTAYSVGVDSSIGKLLDKTNSLIRRFFS